MLSVNSTTATNSSDVFIAGAGSVAALDTPQLTQTKLEIRAIVTQIAELSASDTSLAEYTQAVLPRVCNAMGASAAAIWEVQSGGQISTLAVYQWPDLIDLVEGNAASRDHLRILECAVAEGAPVLVPPKSVRITADRPTNPLDEALLLVPIRIHDRCDMLLEVIQPASGGPAAQRGYLRFVAQMADLMAEYFRRRQLRSYAQQSDYVQRLQRGLIAVSRGRTTQDRYNQTASTLANLLGADLAILLTQRSWRWPGGNRWQVRAISHVPAFDARSEIVVAAERSLATLRSSFVQTDAVTTAATAAQSQVAFLSSCDSETQVPSSASIAAEALEDSNNTDDLSAERNLTDQPMLAKSASASCDQLRHLLGCDHLAKLSLSADERCQVLLALDSTSDLQIVRARAIELADAFGVLVSSIPQNTFSGALGSSSGTAASNPRPTTTANRIERLVVRASSVLLVLAIALFPMPDQVASVAVLEVMDKEFYFAPSSATVEEVHADNHQFVRQNELLMRLVDPQLLKRKITLMGEMERAENEIDSSNEAVLAKSPSHNGNVYEIISRREQAEAIRKSAVEELMIVEKQLSQLNIVAAHDSIITTFDARNRLQGRPVAPGQLLASARSPYASWQLRLSIAERQAGRVQDALNASPQGLPVQFSLSSHPSEVRTGRLVSLSKQLIKDPDGTSKVIGMVTVDAESLPNKTDGAVARASIDCGRTVASWLIFRDAYREARAWWRLNF